VNGIDETLIGGVELGTAILLPALGELIGERAGIVNLGIEGSMLAGALSAVAVTLTTGSVVLGILAGLAAGAAVAFVHAYLVVVRGADQLASGLSVWFVALGLTSVFGSSYIGQTVDPLKPIKVPGLSAIPWLGPTFLEHSILVWVALLLVAVVSFVLFRTRIGLTIRASGERPEVVAATGGRPRLVQIAAVTAGGALAGLGGAHLSVAAAGNWDNNMTKGYGFVAVAVVLFASWRPLGVLAGSFLFGIALALASVFQVHDVAVNQYLLDALPYLITLIALLLFARGGSARAPEGLRRALTNTT